jgi:hypothetical protein
MAPRDPCNVCKDLIKPPYKALFTLLKTWVPSGIRYSYTRDKFVPNEKFERELDEQLRKFKERKRAEEEAERIRLEKLQLGSS